MAESSNKLPRWSLAGLSLLHALVFGWAAIILPWRAWTILSILTIVLALAHVLTAVAAALAHARLAWVWRACSVLSLAYLAFVGWSLLASAFYVASIYRGLGEGVAAALGAVVGLLVLLTVPVAAWGIAATGGIRKWKKLGAALLVTAVLVLARLWMVDTQTQGTEIVDAATVESVRTRVAAIDAKKLRQPKGPRASLMTPEPAQCSATPGRELVTLIVTHVKMDGKRAVAASHCIQRATAMDAADALATYVEENAWRGDVKVDLVRRLYELPHAAPLVESLAFRPGLDGACASNGRCLMPWQLVALDAFVSHAPIPAVPDARLGASLERLANRLEASRDDLIRIETDSWLASPGVDLLTLGRLPSADVDVSAKTVRAAADAAGRYVYFSQTKTGLFNYIVLPFSGEVIAGNFSIARQAGTTVAACELAPQAKWATRLATRSLALLAKHEQRFSIGDHDAGVLRWKPRDAVERMGPTALALAAFITCRERIGDGYDDLIARLSRTLLQVQREDGSFHHYIDTSTGQPVVRKGSIFVDGQLIFSLSLMETIAQEGDGKYAPRAQFVDATEKAMTFFGDHYWDIAIEPFLYIEENWHCIAAARSLSHHRHASYEQFCLDYVAMKARIVHLPESEVHPDFVGGYGFGNVVPPHNTATAGYGEALASAIRIKRESGMDITEDSERLQLVMGFLLKNQWNRRACYACSTKRRIIGAFSEHMASPRVRIDYVQHVWSALGHGAIALDWAEEPS